ncbi:MAG TPA: DUF2127 domain-containing protein [Candidatus Polarisedimenticolia bacterium]|nr:DUF2127 domain-containing protein [Candidatus Polarisedimenticolia bacterium]
MTSKSLLRATFRTGITMKGIDGLLETIGGALLWVINPSVMSHTVALLFQHELSRDPHDFIGVHLLRISKALTENDRLFASIYLVSHGVVKIVLAGALWLDDLWAYPLAIFVFGAFGAYQIYRYSHTHSLMLLALTIFDLALIWLTWEEYRVQKAKRATLGTS